MDEKQPQSKSVSANNAAARTSVLGVTPSVALQDLSSDALISNAQRMEITGTNLPALGGIPLLAKLGQGGMGAVYYGVHPRLEKEVAVKVLPFHLAEQQPEMIQRFFREAKIAAKVQSPHLVNVSDVNQESGLCYLVMEFVSGKSAGSFLKEVKKEGKEWLPENVALDICIAATEGLAAAHAQGIIHRDIKPDNIMIPADRKKDGSLDFNAAKLADLGLARDADYGQALTATGACMGTPGFMAPEQAMDAKSVSKPGDVFSMGATLYAMLCGNAPFAGSTLMKILLATQNEPHKPAKEIRPDISARTAALLDRSLAKDPAARFPDAASLLDELKSSRAELGKPAAKSVVQSAPPPQSSKPNAEAPQSAAAPHKSPVGILAGAAVLICVAVVVVILTRGGANNSAKPDTKAPAEIPPHDTEKPVEVKPAPVVAAKGIDEAWIKSVRALQNPFDQFKQVLAKLKELNPTWDSPCIPHVNATPGAQIDRIVSGGAGLEDISPLRALSSLKELIIPNSKVRDLSTLSGLQLELINLCYCPVRDVSPLQGMPLKTVQLIGTNVEDLAPFSNCPLQNLSLNLSKVTNLSPLARISTLEELHIPGCSIDDLSPLKSLQNLKKLEFTPTATIKGIDVIRQMKNITEINRKDPDTFWKQFDKEFRK